MATSPIEPKPPTADLSAVIESTTAKWARVIAVAAARFGLDGFDRDDLTQRVRLRLWRALEERGPGGEDRLSSSYGYRAAMSAAIDIARERRSRRSAEHVSLEVAGGNLAGPALGPSDADLVSALEAALAGLDPARRVAVKLHLSGEHLRQIAVITGWTESKARNLLYRGLDDLKERLTEEAER